MHVPLQPMVLLSQLDLLAASRRVALHQAQRHAQCVLLLLLLRVRLLSGTISTASVLLGAVVRDLRGNGP